MAESSPDYTDVNIYATDTSPLLEALDMEAVRISHDPADAFRSGTGLALMHGDVQDDAALGLYVRTNDLPNLSGPVLLQAAAIELHARLTDVLQNNRIHLHPRAIQGSAREVILREARGIEAPRDGVGFSILHSPILGLVLPDRFKKNDRMAPYYEDLIKRIAVELAKINP